MKKIIFTYVIFGFLFGQNSILKQFSDQFAEIAEKANPAVVTILTQKNIDLGKSHQEIPKDSDLFQFYFNQPRQREYKTSGVGSGVIIDGAKGHIVTNNHVVEGMDDITVRLLNKEEYKASIVGRDPKSDIAIIKIKAKGLSDLKIGNSDRLRVGEWVMAVGSPFSANLSHTVTAGIVSAKGRGNIMQGDLYEDFIQTDAAINPGNSGGALLNSSGELIGINTAIYTGGYSDRSNKGVGFAIPSNMVKKVMTDLIKYGEVLRSFIGVHIQSVDDTKARALDLNSRNGALVANVIDNGPADKAGIQEGDVIVEFNGIKIKGVDHLRNSVSVSKPDKNYDITLIRNKQTKSIQVLLERMPSDEVLLSENKQLDFNELGVRVATLTNQNRKKYKIRNNDKGVVVIDLAENSPLAIAGIKIGDLITRVGAKKCRTVNDLMRLVRQTQKKGVVMFHIRRDGLARYLTVELES